MVRSTVEGSEAGTTTVFPVSILLGSSEELHLWVEASDPEVAVTKVRRLEGDVPGIYSVWDPEDPMGMPVLEVIVGD